MNERNVMSKKLEIKELNIEHLPDVMELQRKVIAGLQADEKHFVLMRSAQDFMKALEHEHTYMLGVFDGDKLIAQSIFAYPQNGQERDLSEFAEDVPNNELVIYKAILVDKDYRGCGLMKSMLDYIEKESKKFGKKTSIIQIAIDNPASWISAMNNGMEICKVDRDPYDNAKVLYLKKNLQKSNLENKSLGNNHFTMYVGKNIHREIPALFNKMQYRIAQGYRGVGVDQKNHSLIWSKQDIQARQLWQIRADVQGKTIQC